MIIYLVSTYRWRHNGRDGVSNHQPHDCLLNRLFRHRSKKTSKLRVTGLCAGNSPGTGEFPAQRASDAENVSIWWRHHENDIFVTSPLVSIIMFACSKRYVSVYMYFVWTLISALYQASRLIISYRRHSMEAHSAFWPFVMGIKRSPVRVKWTSNTDLWYFFIVCLNKMLNKQLMWYLCNWARNINLFQIIMTSPYDFARCSYSRML